MDILSQMLDEIEMQGSLYFATDFGTPFGLRVPRDANVCRFHVVTRGHCWLEVPESGEAVLLSQGDLGLVPHGAEHLLRSARDAPLDRLDEALADSGFDGRQPFSWGGEGPRTRMVCGYFGFDREIVHPLLDQLPALIHLRGEVAGSFRWIEQVLSFLGTEAQSDRPGSRAIANRLSEILFIQALRLYSESVDDPLPLLAGLSDPHLGRALRAIHGAPGTHWTLERLAREARQSRTAFAERFRTRLGTTPARYLAAVRMRLARQLLAQDLSVTAIAERVGYESEAAFQRRFKSFWSLGPGAMRRRLAESARRPPGRTGSREIELPGTPGSESLGELA